MIPARDVEFFPALQAIPGIRHAFTQRIRGLDVAVEREEALARLEKHLTAARHELGVGEKVFITGTQVHGADVAIVDADSSTPVQGVDGLITADPEVCLGIYVADCCAVYLVDPVKKVIALLHSGKKGTEQAISAVAIQRMRDEFGCAPADMVAQLSPCIRPPQYEIDFAAQVVAQCRAEGVASVHDTGTCTAANVEHYYSYRREKGKTGRMLALLALSRS